MKKIIDISSCEPTQLREFFASSPSNIAVFNDYGCMEAYKNGSTSPLSESLVILSEFADQIEVLRDTRQIVQITVDSVDPLLFVDDDRRHEFLSFCTCIQLAIEGNAEIHAQIKGHGIVASAYFGLIKSETKYIAEGISLLSTSFSTEELAIIKKGTGYTLEIVDKMLQNIFLLTNILFKRYPEITKPSMDRGTVRCYFFRYALCCYLLFMRWVSGNSVETFTEDKLRDDIMDMPHVVYATYFDGLLTSNKKMSTLYQEANHLIHNILLK